MVYVQLQTDQLRGKVTFEQACQELHCRCEAIRADNLLDSKFRATGKALISTEIKHLNKEKSPQNKERLPCLAKDCAGMIVSFLPLCRGCFLQCKSGKVTSLELRDGLGVAKFNATTLKIEFPPGVPKTRLPGNPRAKEVRKGLMVRVPVHSSCPESAGIGLPSHEEPLSNDVPEDSFSRLCLGGYGDLLLGAGHGNSVRCFTAIGSARVTFFVDSGAGQCLCSISNAFSDLQPCRIEVTGVSGSLPIYGCGTANFVAKDHDGHSVILRIPNCLFGRCKFNLLSVSQLNQVRGNRVEFNLLSVGVGSVVWGNSSIGACSSRLGRWVIRTPFGTAGRRR